MRRLARPTLLALPALALAVAGLFHPHHLTYDTSWRWFTLHLPGLLVFPLVGLALAALVGTRTDPLAWAIRVTAYVYATFYTALDVISGVAAGYVTHELGPGVPRPEAVSLLFRIGTPLGELGSWALLATCALVVVDQVHRHRARGAVALVLLPGAWLVHVGHIFAPEGVVGMLLLGVGTAAAATADATPPN
ncbi:hypothetical protein [Nocardioides mangrovi]|uniref:Uncharacterized protein n=1 Tax=Nocardioides mangrovi TaxID=2874580 RepID=A0ABS7U788_9ACTN|nr:hypothetical protein [Nocardioides mangrovi]MBZ5736603.1 hypothetical protein [Nocardioides mangrovi]